MLPWPRSVAVTACGAERPQPVPGVHTAARSALAVASHQPARLIALEVRSVRMPLHDSLPAAVLLGPLDRLDERTLSVSVDADDAQFLLDRQRRRGQRGRLESWIECLAATLGGRLALQLVTAEPDEPPPEAPLASAGEIMRVSVEPGHSLVAAIRLGVPLLGDLQLLRSDPAELPRVAAFLEVCLAESPR